MLIDFTVENYRSIKEPVTLSAVAETHGSNKLDNKIAEPFSYPSRKLEILPALGIFGANASGKSNVINALNTLLLFTSFSYALGVVYEDISPFKLGNGMSKLPSRFRLRAICEGNIYTFELSVNSHKILHEKVSYIPANSKRAVERRLYERTWDSKLGGYNVKNGEYFGEKYREIQLSLGESQSFMALLTKSIKVKVLEPFTLWLNSRWPGVSLNNRGFDYGVTCSVLEKNPYLMRRVRTLMQKFDVGIHDIEVKKLEGENTFAPQYEVWVSHKIKDKVTKWLLKEESLGTQRLFEIATKLFHAIELGGLVLVDELGYSTHPAIDKEIVRLLQVENINKNRAQLIFTSHDSSLLSLGLLRRDQVWFTEKRDDGSTELFPLSDFVGIRTDLVMDKAYLHGRFGAVPILPDSQEIIELLGVN